MSQLIERMNLDKPLNFLIAWSLICLTICPLVGSAALLVLDPLWDQISPTTRRSVVALTAGLGFRSAQVAVAEALAVLYVVAVAAIGLAGAFGLAKPSWPERLDASVALFPAAIAVVAAPAVMVFAHGAAFGDSPAGGRAVSEFVALFAAFATATGFAYSLWVLLHRAAVRPATPRFDSDQITLWS